MIRMLTITTLYPNSEQPIHGIFVEQRLRLLIESGAVEAKVLAPVPFFPFDSRVFGKYAKYARVPAREHRNGIDVLHPRYIVIPKVGQTVAPVFLALCLLPAVREISRRGYKFDLIDAHFFYPDGVAAMWISQFLKIPVVITARGTDINLYPSYAIPRCLITKAANTANGVITVSESLRQEIMKLGVSGEKVTTLRNGVDLKTFYIDHHSVVQRVPVCCEHVLISVGHLIRRKGHDIVIRGVAKLRKVGLIIIGEGEERSALEELVEQLGVQDRVIIKKAMTQSELRGFYTMADALVLASESEGWANVLLESMACGTPVIASMVGGTPDVVTAPEAGVLMNERTPDAFVAAFKQLFSCYPNAVETRRFAEKFSWEATTSGQLEMFDRIVAETRTAN